MLRVVDFVNFSSILTNSKRHDIFRIYFQQRQNLFHFENDVYIDEMNETKIEKMIVAQNELRNDILKIVHVVITTMTNVEKFKLYNVFSSNFIIVDEFARFLKTNI